FEWKWNDIAAECVRFLGPYGFCAVQTSPANENRIITNPYRPWWERYQPVSYKIHTRSGSEDEFRNMVEKCNKSGVRIYVDVVFNHMTGAGGQGFGTNGTFYDGDNLHFPGVPYGPTDFNDGSLCHSCDMNIHNYDNGEEGPPHNSDMTTASVQISGMSCTNGWSCEHRWRQIYNMVGFRNMVSGTALNNWWSGADYQIAFSRGNKGFIALNLESFDINQNVQTGLPAGRYCDVISGDIDNDRCTGKTVEVYNDGTAHINVCSNCDDPVLAIHVGAKIGSPPRRF
uniref:alpha-amylase n=1 Tax=Biomphalaria glabrata TaxID=6526 RepID=A0A2C9KDQ1_BIOGL